MDFYCPVCDTLLPDTMICPVCNGDVPVLRQRLVLEAFGCAGLDDISLAYRFIEALAKEMDVELYAPPIVMRTLGQGITAVGVLLESACVLHTWPEYGFADLYIECCKRFETVGIPGLIKVFFGAGEVKEVIDSKAGRGYNG
jgi:S-adenosylmethionine/arginine decarboxylase-like enzyme